MNLTAIDTLETAVANGVAYLDSRYSGWRWRITEPVEVSCLAHSVTGQLFGEVIMDQMRGVGITIDLDNRTEAEAVRVCQEFAAMGFAVMMNTPFRVPEFMREAALADGVELPEWIPVPRDPDVCIMEISTLTTLWEREVAQR